jgi:hypothetical protein
VRMTLSNCASVMRGLPEDAAFGRAAGSRFMEVAGRVLWPHAHVAANNTDATAKRILDIPIRWRNLPFTLRNLC